MFNITIGIREAFKALDSIANSFPEGHVAANPDPNSNATCTYAVRVDGVLTPVCIVGQWLATIGLLGVVLDSFPGSAHDSYIDQTGACVINSPIWSRLAALGILVDDEAREFFRSAQNFQDGGWYNPETGDNSDMTWRTAVREAARLAHDKRVKELPTYGLV